MCNCMDKALERNYVHCNYFSEQGKDAYIKHYFIKASMGKGKVQDIFINNCMWCGEKLPVGEPKTLKELPIGFNDVHTFID